MTRGRCGAGDFGAYLAHTTEISAFCTRLGDVRSSCWARGNMAYAQMILGAYPDAEVGRAAIARPRRPRSGWGPERRHVARVR